MIGRILTGGGCAFIFGAVLLVVAIILVSCVRIVSQSEARVVERLGGYNATWGVGIHMKLPFLDKVVKSVSLKEQVLDFDPQPVITKDNVTMRIDTVVYYQVTDPKLYTYGVESPLDALENLSATTLRNIIGDLELDQTLTGRDVINAKMRSILDEATDPWGIKVNRVEVKNIIPPDAIKEAMEKQMRAERERREAILIAEGKKQSLILVAEGEKQSAILAAEAAKAACVEKAQGEAEAILAVQKAKADGIRMIREAAADSGVIRLRELEAWEKIADGRSTKIIVPSKLESLSGTVAAMSEVIGRQSDGKQTDGR